MQTQKYKKLIRNNSVIFQNLTYITLLELFIVISPLITYPYLVKILGSELYGLVIIAQVIASYAVIVVNFGFRSITAKDISIHRENKDKLSEIVSSIFIIRTVLWVTSFILYFVAIFLIPLYNKHMLLFMLSFGITFNDLLFPQFYFQGIEKMKFITFINIGVNSIFIILIFLFVKNETDYYFVPLFKSIGFFIGGLISIYIVFSKQNLVFIIPNIKVLKTYIKDALPIFSTQIITSIKDKFSYILLGSFVGMHEVVIYDLGAKFTSLLVKPVTILSRVLLPKIAREKNIRLYKKTAIGSFILMVIVIIVFNLLLPIVVKFFLSESINLIPLRIFSLAPLFLSISSYIATNCIIAFNYNRYILYSIIVTTIVYLGSTGIFYFLNGLNSILAFIIITVTAYFAEFVYRLIISKKIIKNVAS
jgi:PST family polysaccharide transporter